MSNVRKCVIILAAGQGKRTFSTHQKVLQPLAGQPMLHHVLSSAYAIKPDLLQVVIGYESQKIRDTFNDSDCINWVNQDVQLGTGHAVQQAINQWEKIDKNSIVFVLYGDVPIVYKETLKRLLEVAQKNEIALLTKMVKNPIGYGRIIRDEKNFIQAIVEHKDTSVTEREIHEINTGIMAINAQLLSKCLKKLQTNNVQKELYLTDVVHYAVKFNCEVGGVEIDDALEAQGVNNFTQLAQLEQLYQRKKASDLAERGLRLVSLERLDVRGKLTFGTDVFVDINNIFVGDVHLEDGVQIGANCILENCKIGKNTIVHPFSHLLNCEIGEACIVGPYARLRGNSVVGNASVIGNFSEINRSTVGSNVKMKHFSYLGDALVEDCVNIGAGMVVCNFDGKKKHSTFIKNGAFIGANSTLIAPLCVHKNALIGAGSVITKDPPEQQVTLSRAEQKSFKRTSK